MIPHLSVDRWWACPSCDHLDVTRDPRPITPLHACGKQAGLAVPLVQVRSNVGLRKGSVRHVAVERGDYAGEEVGLITDARGRVISAVRTERADGSNDVHVFAPAARADMRPDR